ncbi:hypothetical protein ABZ349_03270 [Streptomyces niveus]
MRTNRPPSATPRHSPRAEHEASARCIDQATSRAAAMWATVITAP